MIKRGISIVTWNRAERLGQVIQSVLDTAPEDCNVFVCDDASDDDTIGVASGFPVTIIGGKDNLGVAANKNRALFAMQNCDYMAILEDDLVAEQGGWFEHYEQVARVTANHHFCRVQDKEVAETIPSFSTHLQQTCGATPIYASSPRGDLTFITQKVTNVVGGFNSKFVGVGYGHGEWSARVAKASLIAHPLKWWDIKEARDCFIQVGDTEGGRWEVAPEEIKKQIKTNRNLSKRLGKIDYIYHPLVLS